MSSGNDEACAFIENPCPLEWCHEGTGFYPTLLARMMPVTIIYGSQHDDGPLI
jgi:hypothetical protein